MTSPKEAEFEQLLKEFNSMGNMVHEAVNTATSAILNNDSTHIDEIIANDKLIDGRENTIDQHCIRLWATQAPVAADLRLIFTIIRSTNELERIGDHAKSIARSVKSARVHGPVFVTETIKNACNETPTLIDQALSAQQNMNGVLANEVREKCKIGKKGFKALHDAFVPAFSQQEHNIHALLDALAIGRDLQRIYALTANICKNTIFQLEGNMVRHKGRENPLES